MLYDLEDMKCHVGKYNPAVKSIFSHGFCGGMFHSRILIYIGDEKCCEKCEMWKSICQLFTC